MCYLIFNVMMVMAARRMVTIQKRMVIMFSCKAVVGLFMRYLVLGSSWLCNTL